MERTPASLSARLLPALLVAGAPLAADPAAPPVGPYRPLALLGRGTMGEVHLAEQVTPVRRLVALKTLPPGVPAHGEVGRRLADEGQALAIANHDHVVRLYDAGTDAAGQPYLALEYVPGEPITAYAARHHLSLDERLQLFLQVCDAAAHLDEHQLVHRDLKPANILVTEQGGMPSVKVIDLGLACYHPTAHVDVEDPVVGSPGYMAPEQARPGSAPLTGRADVYALGALLFELVTGTLPLADPTKTPAGPRPSLVERQESLWRRSPPSLRTRAQRCRMRGVSRALDRVAQRALTPDPAARFAGAGALASAVRDEVQRRARRQRARRVLTRMLVGAALLAL
ncbi:MAG: serine/threonine-protein kinase [Planctomycetota bacterium]